MSPWVVPGVSAAILAAHLVAAWRIRVRLPGGGSAGGAGDGLATTSGGALSSASAGGLGQVLPDAPAGGSGNAAAALPDASAGGRGQVLRHAPGGGSGYAAGAALSDTSAGAVEDASVALIRPVRGLDPGAATTLASGRAEAAEVVYSLQDPEDPALPLCRSLGGRVVIHPVAAGWVAKASNLAQGVAATRGKRLAFCDADIDLAPGCLTALTAPLGDPAVGVVAAVPVHVGGRGLWGFCYQLHLNATVLLQWLPYAALGLPAGVPGAAVALRRETLAHIGGVAAFARYVAEDVRFGQLLRQTGLRIAVGPAVTSPVGAATWAKYRSLIERGAVIFGLMLPWPLGVFQLVFSYWYWPAGLLAAAGLAPGWLGPAIAYLGLRMLTAAAGEWLLSPRPLPAAALALPVMDATSMWIAAATLVHRHVHWRGSTYRVGPGGAIAS